MAKPEWGRKLSCTSCGVKFYDLHRNPAECPACGTQNDPLQTWKPKRTRAAAKAAVPAKPVEETPTPADLPEDEDMPTDDVDLDADGDDEDDEDLMEDTSDLGGDDDDMSEVAEHIESDGPQDT